MHTAHIFFGCAVVYSTCLAAGDAVSTQNDKTNQRLDIGGCRQGRGILYVVRSTKFLVRQSIKREKQLFVYWAYSRHEIRKEETNDDAADLRALNINMYLCTYCRLQKSGKNKKK